METEEAENPVIEINGVPYQMQADGLYKRVRVAVKPVPASKKPPRDPGVLGELVLYADGLPKFRRSRKRR